MNALRTIPFITSLIIFSVQGTYSQESLLSIQGSYFSERSDFGLKNTTTTGVKQEKARMFKHVEQYVHIGYTSAILEGDAGTTSNRAGGFYGGIDVLSGEKVFLMMGVGYFVNQTGAEFMTPLVSQNEDPGKNIQGFRLNFGLGTYAVNNGDLSVNIHANARLLLATSINGNLSSIGNAVIEKQPVTINIGSHIGLDLLAFYISYERGIRPVLSLSGENMNYQMLNAGIGIRVLAARNKY